LLGDIPYRFLLSRCVTGRDYIERFVGLGSAHPRHALDVEPTLARYSLLTTRDPVGRVVCKEENAMKAKTTVKADWIISTAAALVATVSDTNRSLAL
jgi:hypothetical protein